MATLNHFLGRFISLFAVIAVSLRSAHAIVNVTCGVGTVFDSVTSQCVIPLSSGVTVRAPTIATNESMLHLFGNDMAFHDLRNPATLFPTFVVAIVAHGKVQDACLSCWGGLYDGAGDSP